MFCSRFNINPISASTETINFSRILHTWLSIAFVNNVPVRLFKHSKTRKFLFTKSSLPWKDNWHTDFMRVCVTDFQMLTEWVANYNIMCVVIFSSSPASLSQLHTLGFCSCCSNIQGHILYTILICYVLMDAQWSGSMLLIKRSLEVDCLKLVSILFYRTCIKCEQAQSGSDGHSTCIECLVWIGLSSVKLVLCLKIITLEGYLTSY